jgi:hypothetical protein
MDFSLSTSMDEIIVSIQVVKSREEGVAWLSCRGVDFLALYQSVVSQFESNRGFSDYQDISYLHWINCRPLSFRPPFGLTEQSQRSCRSSSSSAQLTP